MSKLKDGNYIGVQAFMVRDLHLKGNELLVYALIYGFTQAEQQKFTGSLAYIAEWTSSTKQGVLKNIKSLLDKGLIAKNEATINGIRYCEYYSTEFNTIKLEAPKTAEGYLTLDSEGIKQSLPKNIDINYKENTNNNSYRQEPKIQGVENRGLEKFNRPSLEEVQAYCEERQNGVDAVRFVNYYTSNGWKVGKNPMKDWKAAVRTWEKTTPKRERRSDLDDIF